MDKRLEDIVTLNRQRLILFSDGLATELEDAAFHVEREDFFKAASRIHGVRSLAQFVCFEPKDEDRTSLGGGVDSLLREIRSLSALLRSFSKSVTDRPDRAGDVEYIAGVFAQVQQRTHVLMSHSALRVATTFAAFEPRTPVSATTAN